MGYRYVVKPGTNEGLHLNEDTILDLIDQQPDAKLAWHQIDSIVCSEKGGLRAEIEGMLRFGLLGCDDIFIWTIRGAHGTSFATTGLFGRVGGNRTHDYRTAAEVGPRDTFARMAHNAELDALEDPD